MQRRGVVVASLLGVLLLSAPYAAAGNSQQDKMKACNAEATQKSLKGADRKAFMQTCLAAGSAPAAVNSQQDKMKSCNADATQKSLKGADRKAFMKTCLSAK